MKYPDFKDLKMPESGKVISYSDNKIVVSDNPIIPFIQGDGIGKDVWPAAKLVIDEAVKIAYKGQKQIMWLKLLAGEEAYQQTGEYLPADTMKAIEYFKVSIKGPLTTPVGGGIRSLNVTIRQKLDLYACVRPVRYFEGIPSVVRNPENIDVVIFRENTEDLYKGIEYQSGSLEVKKLIDFLNSEFKASINHDSGIGIKLISESASKRIIRRALNYAIDNNRKSVTLVHKGNIMKFTEGAFRKWGYELVEQEYKDQVITVKELKEKYNGLLPEDKVLVKDVITDAMFQEMLLRPEEYDVIATMNLNGDYLSDACAAQVGGLGLAPGANMSDSVAVFEATHGTAPDIAGKDLANPSSLILSAVMMLEYLGWQESADLIVNAIEKAIKARAVTGDIKIKDAQVLKCSEFASTLVEMMK